MIDEDGLVIILSRLFLLSLRDYGVVIVSSSRAATVDCVLKQNFHLFEVLILVHVVGYQLKRRSFGFFTVRLYGKIRVMDAESVGISQGTVAFLGDKINKKFLNSSLLFRVLSV